MKRQTDPDVLLLQAAADPTRLAILRQLAACDGPICACDFTDCCNLSQPTVSHHLRLLREAGWVSSERRGSWVWYSLRPEALKRLGALVEQITPPSTPTAVPGGSRGRLPVIQPLN
jgi:ArsR family transcriptional regulator